MKEKYINPFTDFGFKKIFGEEANKDLLIAKYGLKYYRDLKNVMDTAREEGREEIREEVKAETTMKIAKNLKDKGLDIALIAEATGLSEDAISKL